MCDSYFTPRFDLIQQLLTNSCVVKCWLEVTLQLFCQVMKQQGGKKTHLKNLVLTTTLFGII